jgi:signal transduction histidine kinase
MSQAMFKANQSIFKVIIATTLSAVVVSVLALSILFYHTMIAPIQDKVFAETAALMYQELQSRLQSKEDSVISVAVGLSRDQRVIDGLANSNREPLISAIKDIGDDYARTSQYKMIRAQVIDQNQIIVARSWDVDFQGQKAPHPLVKQVKDTRQAAASFGVGNAGVGVIGFAPVFSNQQFVGMVSITQNIGSVVRNLKAQHIDWVMLVHKPTLVARTDGKLPESYQKHPALADDTLLAHPTLFSSEAVERVKKHVIPLQASLTNMQFVVDEKFITVKWIYDESGKLVGQHVLMQDAQPVLDKVAETERHIILVSSAELFMLLLLVVLLLWLVRRLIVRPLAEVTKTMSQVMHSGDFSYSLPVHGSNELEQMKTQLNVLLSHISFAIREANDAVSAAAHIDFERKMKGEFVGDLHNLQLGINKAISDLQQTHDLLTDATKTKAQFLANMSHEIRTPINGIVGMLTLLQGSNLTIEQAEHLRLAQSSADLLLGVVNDILDFSKIEAGKMTIEAIPYNLREVLANTRSVFGQVAQQKGIQLNFEKAENISEYVVGDALRVRQVITNLLSNAMKFTEQGSVTLSVSLDDDCLHFEVCDTGIGMSEAVRERLFQSFSQADASTSRKFGGTGLGLTISKELVVLMGGDIGVNSEIDKGSCFWFNLPYKPSRAPQAKETESSVLTFVGKHILLVEDNIVNQKVATKLLERFGIRVTLADNGQKALDILADISVDLVFMDCQMPVMDGYTATRVLRQQDFKTPIVAMTANASAQDRAECIACGMNDFIAKPYQLHELSAILQRWLLD